MTLRDIVTLVARKRGLEADNTYTANLLELAKQRARQVWESHDWPERLRIATQTVTVGSQTAVISAQYFHSLVGLQNMTTREAIEPRSLTDFHRSQPTSETTPAHGFPTSYALQRLGNADSWEIVFDSETTEAWTMQLLYRLTRQSMFEDRDDTDGDILIPGAETVLEHHIEADSLEMDEQRGAANQQRGMAEQRLNEMKERAARTPANQRVRPAVNFTDED